MWIMMALLMFWLNFMVLIKKRDQNFYLFVGYDIYYYFNSPNEKQLAMVRFPVVPLPLPTYSGTAVAGNKWLLEFPYDLDNLTRFLTGGSGYNSSTNNFYQTVSFPIPYNAISSILTEGANSNVRFDFDASTDIYTQNNTKNPFVNTSEKYVIIGSVYPNYNEYVSQTDWYITTDPNDTNFPKRFRGFYDQRYYQKKGIAPYEGSDIYRVNFYIVSKGFPSSAIPDRTPTAYVSSAPSSVFTVKFKAYPAP